MPKEIDYSIKLDSSGQQLLHNDANLVGFFEQQLEQVLAKTYDIKYPQLKGTTAIPVDTSINSGAESFAFKTYDMVGMAKIISDYSQALPRVGIKGQKTVRPIRSIGASFGCPFEGDVPTARVTSIARRLVRSGAGEIVLADTIGCAAPNQVAERVAAVADGIGAEIPLGCHFHNTRNTGFANAAAAVQAGIRHLDSSVGGIGGCPFAPRATGNIATEDLCYMLRQMGYQTGVDMDALIGVAEWTEAFFDNPLPGQVMKAGLFPEVAANRTP